MSVQCDWGREEMSESRTHLFPAGMGDSLLQQWDGSAGAPTVAQLVPTKSDADRAGDLKAQLHAAWLPILALMDEAAKAGFLVRWAAVQPNLFGKHELIDLHLVKRF
jgi:hypothetical protein